MDFGLSKMVAEKVGQKSYTNFIGTFPYVSPEMQKTYFLRQRLPVDLYENDQCGLKKIYEFMSNQK